MHNKVHFKDSLSFKMAAIALVGYVILYSVQFQEYRNTTFKAFRFITLKVLDIGPSTVQFAFYHHMGVILC